MRGRKPRQETRADEFRERLMQWKRMPERLRPSLRALARELGTTHQLLAFYLDGLDIRQAREEQERKAQDCRCIADRIRDQAKGRDLTPWEEQQFDAYDLRYVRAAAGASLLKQIEALHRKAKRERLNCWDVKTLKLFAKYRLPGAQELLQKCASQAPSRSETERAMHKDRQPEARR